MAAPAPAGESPYGLMAALNEGGVISWATFIILVAMSVFSFYILFTKLFEQQKIIAQGRKVRSSFWNAPNLKDAASKLDQKSAYRAIVDDALLAQDQHSKLTNPIDQHDWMANSLARSQGGIGARLGEGLAFLATVGSTAPFIGLFGTVVGIYRALIKIGASGQASISTVAGPVGEALIMTALGLVVAVPAVLAYNWLIRRNKSIMEDLAAFTNDLHGYIMSEGRVKPSLAASGAANAGSSSVARGAQTRSGTAPTPAGTQPLTAGQTSTGQQASGTGTTTVDRR
ncbi:MAG: MotA/TolQ/ExbB proton channel family protein [uncultured Sphingomonas sp.]|uniref:Biopolymer transport protein ExbB n=1 Tax=uncultured Sphingomonas sp. TaxID=158754 RepID=A0A6J4TJ64_9SPHN|nr:MotA/TolQ/ExbB proton channel family protein [uncultured Sphingomonas sp.]CAA9523925.1 MAG: MotA/TolQ/ExbB proton channel family protein [uncultured Sphingomonas sp.]